MGIKHQGNSAWADGRITVWFCEKCFSSEDFGKTERGLNNLKRTESVIAADACCN